MAEINVRITAAARELLRELDKVDRGVDEVTRSADKMGKELDSSTRDSTSRFSTMKAGVLALGGAFAVAKIGQGIKFAVDAAIKQEEVERKVAATVESMNAATWTSVAALKAQASAFQDTTTFGDEAVLGYQDILLTFGNVVDKVGEGNDVFTQATALGLDMSAALGQDLKSSAIQLGKALNDPITGVGALTRVGVSFTTEQKEMIKALAESGDLMGAQKIILRELESQFGGTAAAIAETTGGQLQQAMNKLGDAAEVVGAELAPVLVDVAEIAVGLVPLLEGVAAGVSSILSPAKDLAEQLAGIATWMDVSSDSTEGSTSALEGWVNAALSMLQVRGVGTGLTEQAEKAARAEAAALLATSAALDTARHSVDRNREATTKYEDATGDAIQETEFWEQALSRGLNPTLEEGRRKLDEMTGSLEEQRDAMRRAADPVFALRDAQLKLAEAQGRLTTLTDKGKQGTEEYEEAQFDLVKASADLSVAQGRLGDSMVADGGAIAAFREAATAAGLSKEEVDLLIASLERLDGSTYRFNVEAGGIGGRLAVIPGPGAKPIPVAHGGVVKAQTGGTLLQAGEAGTDEAVIPLNSEGEAFVRNALGGGNGGGPTIIVQGFVGSEMQLAQEIDRLLTRRGRTQTLGFT